MKYVVVTGASTGIGKDAVEYLIKKNYFVFGSVRSEQDAQKLKQELGEQFEALIFDVTDSKAIGEQKQKVQDKLEGKYLSGLVNNAGMFVGGPLMHLPIEDLQKQFEVNVFGQIRVTQEFLPLLGAITPQEHKPGCIINISSIGGKVTTPFCGPYNSSKYALESLSDALRRELRIYGIPVVVVEPGSIKTPIWEKNLGDNWKDYDQTIFKEPLAKMTKLMGKVADNGMSPKIVSKTIHKILESKSPKARYALPDRPFEWRIAKSMPDKMLDNAICGRLGLNKKDNS